MHTQTEAVHPIRISGNCCGPDVWCSFSFEFLKKMAGKPAGSVLAEEKDDVRLREGRHPILCRRCGQEITLAEYAVTISGRHEHTFTNPAGVTFQIGCFSIAAGCAVYGAPVLEFTWFPGFAWSVCLCANCMLHLGWFYQSIEEGFFGLITTNLVKTMRPH
jgi:hypothetical protein